MAPKAQILNITNLLLAGSKGLGVGKSSTIKSAKKDFKALLKSFTSKVKQKSSKLKSNILKEETAVILPFSFSEVKMSAVNSKGVSGKNILKQTDTKFGTSKNAIGSTKNQVTTIITNNKTEAPKKSKNSFSAAGKTITKLDVNAKSLKNAEENEIGKINGVKNVKIVKNSSKAANGLGMGKDVKILTEQSGPLKAEIKGDHKTKSLNPVKKGVLNSVHKNMSSVPPDKKENVSSVLPDKKVAVKIDRNLLISKSLNKETIVKSSANLKQVDIAPKIKAELKMGTELLSIKDSDPKKESNLISRPNNINSIPLKSKIEKSASRLIAEKSPKPTLLSPKEQSGGIALKTNIVPKNDSNVTSVEKPSSDDIKSPKLNKPVNVEIIKQKQSILIQGMRNSVIHNMQPVSASSIGKKINILQSSVKRAISESNKRGAPTLSLLKTTKSKNNSKQGISQKSVEKNYNNLLNFGNTKSNTLVDSDIKTLFNAQMGTSQDETALTKLKTTFFRSGELFDQSKLQDNNLIKFTIKEIDKELSQIQLRLTPKGLGNIKIDLQQNGNVLSAKFLVETPEIAKLLKDALPELRETLSQQGINLDESDISSRKEEFTHHFNGKNTGNFEGKQQENNTHRNPAIDQNVDVPLELLSQKQTLIYRPNSTVEYLA